jgi:hypothetical protein
MMKLWIIEAALGVTMNPELFSPKFKYFVVTVPSIASRGVSPALVGVAGGYRLAGTIVAGSVSIAMMKSPGESKDSAAATPPHAATAPPRTSARLIKVET